MILASILVRSVAITIACLIAIVIVKFLAVEEREC